MVKLNDEVCRELTQELILQPTRRGREQENMNSDQHQCLSKRINNDEIGTKNRFAFLSILKVILN